jgi:hypothetical protein
VSVCRGRSSSLTRDWLLPWLFSEMETSMRMETSLGSQPASQTFVFHKLQNSSSLALE